MLARYIDCGHALATTLYVNIDQAADSLVDGAMYRYIDCGHAVATTPYVNIDQAADSLVDGVMDNAGQVYRLWSLTHNHFICQYRPGCRFFS